MRFVARAPREGINVSDEHPLKEALILTLGIAAALAVIAALLAAFVDIVIFLVPPETEARIFAGRDIAALLEPEYDRENAGAADALLARLVRHWPDAPYDFRVGILEESEPNAVALPGGTILLTRGLLEEVETENELAFVLGHELGHFRNRDHLRTLGRGVALGLVLLVVSGEDGGLVSSGVLDLSARHFSRRQESAADLYALELVFDEYGHVAGSTRFFERIAGSQRGLGSVGGYFSRHPSPNDRIERLRETALSRGWPVTGELVPLDR